MRRPLAFALRTTRRCHPPAFLPQGVSRRVARIAGLLRPPFSRLAAPVRKRPPASHSSLCLSSCRAPSLPAAQAPPNLLVAPLLPLVHAPTLSPAYWSLSGAAFLLALPSPSPSLMCSRLFFFQDRDCGWTGINVGGTSWQTKNLTVISHQRVAVGASGKFNKEIIPVSTKIMPFASNKHEGFSKVAACFQEGWSHGTTTKGMFGPFS